MISIRIVEKAVLNLLVLYTISENEHAGRLDVSEDRVVLVTGSATGLGAELIRSFAAKGFCVAINFFLDGEADAPSTL